MKKRLKELKSRARFRGITVFEGDMPKNIFSENGAFFFHRNKKFILIRESLSDLKKATVMGDGITHFNTLAAEARKVKGGDHDQT